MSIRQVKKICVLGAGTMGSQIAQLAATTGYEVPMVDIEDGIVQGALDAIKGNLKRFFVDKGKMTQEEADKVLDWACIYGLHRYGREFCQSEFLLE